MKVIKLDKRFKLYQDDYRKLKHTAGLRFAEYDFINIPKYEKYLTSIYGSKYEDGAKWYGYFGSNSRPRPYYITVQHEYMLTALLLAV